MTGSDLKKRTTADGSTTIMCGPDTGDDDHEVLAGVLNDLCNFRPGDWEDDDRQDEMARDFGFASFNELAHRARSYVPACLHKSSINDDAHQWFAIHLLTALALSSGRGGLSDTSHWLVGLINREALHGARRP